MPSLALSSCLLLLLLVGTRGIIWTRSYNARCPLHVIPILVHRSFWWWRWWWIVSTFVELWRRMRSIPLCMRTDCVSNTTDWLCLSLDFQDAALIGRFQLLEKHCRSADERLWANAMHSEQVFYITIRHSQITRRSTKSDCAYKGLLDLRK